MSVAHYRMFQVSSPKAIAETGERIYREQFQKTYEVQHFGKFVAIDVRTGAAFVGDTADAALEQAMAADREGLFHLLRVGFRSAFQLAHATTSEPRSDWIFG